MPAVATPQLDKLRTIIVRDGFRKPHIPFNQLQADPFAGRLWIPDPTLDPCPVYFFDAALQSTEVRLC